MYWIVNIKSQKRKLKKNTYKMVRRLFLKQFFYDMLVSVKNVCVAFLSVYTLLRHIRKTRAG